MCFSRYFFLLVAGVLFLCYLWRTGSLSWKSSSVRAKASIEFDLSIQASASPVAQRPLNKTSKKSSDKGFGKFQGTLSKYMLDLYHRRPDADIVRALAPIHVSVPMLDGRRILIFSIPPVDSDENLEIAELLASVGAVMRVRLFANENGDLQAGILKSRREQGWRAFNVTSAVNDRTGKLVKLYVYGRVGYRPCGDGPILLLSYTKAKKKRIRRSVQEEDHEDIIHRWETENPRKRRRNPCRRRPLYVDFSLIAYDEWVVAPPGYEAFQCAGKCYYPFGDHLSPTNHAIVQTLIHGALQGVEGFSESRPIGRACCVPTKLAPTSLLYLDASGTLTYQYGYEDMVVVECGCR